MSTTKLERILVEVRARLEVIDQAAGFYTDIGCDVRLDRIEPELDDAPLCSVFFGEGSVDEARNKRQRIGLSITVIGYSGLVIGVSPQTRGAQILADIARALELPDRTLGGLLIDSENGLDLESFEIQTPESGVDIVAARATYAVPHVRKYGDPEIAQ